VYYGDSIIVAPEHAVPYDLFFLEVCVWLDSPCSQRGMLPNVLC
jgi:hypothetical protein